MGVEIDEARRDVTLCGIDHAPARGICQIAHKSNPIVPDSHIRAASLHPRSIKNESAAYNQVKAKQSRTSKTLS
jgi:hypothetical protein